MLVTRGEGEGGAETGHGCGVLWAVRGGEAGALEGGRHPSAAGLGPRPEGE